MTLNQLKYFCTAARLHSITKASHELYVTQPTISIAIRDLEVEFGASLFYRQGNQLVLTQEGEAVYAKANYIIAYCVEMQSEFSGMMKAKSTVRIGIPPMLSTVFFPELSEAYRQKYPSSMIRLEEYGSVRACDLVQNDDLDLALINMEVYNLDRFNSAVLAKDQLVFCVSRDHPYAHKKSITTEDMAKEDLIFFNSDSVQNMLLKLRFETAGFNPNIIMRSSQIYTTLQYVKRGDCGCFLFSSMLPKFPDLVGIPMDPPIKVDVGLVWKKGKYMTAEMQRFIDFTIDYYNRNSLVK